VKTYVDFNGDKIKIDKITKVREKPVFHTFLNQNTTKTGRESKLSTLILIMVKLSPTQKPEVREKPGFHTFQNPIITKIGMKSELSMLNLLVIK